MECNLSILRFERLFAAGEVDNLAILQFKINTFGWNVLMNGRQDFRGMVGFCDTVYKYSDTDNGSRCGDDPLTGTESGPG